MVLVTLGFAGLAAFLLLAETLYLIRNW